MPVYKAPVEDYLFVLHDVFGVQHIADLAGFSDLTSDLTRPVLEGMGKFCEDIWQPLNHSGDEEGCRLENGTVRTAAGFPEAYRKYCEAGWNKLASPEQFGGAGLPGVIGVAATKIATGSNASLALYSGLTNAAVQIYGAMDIFVTLASNSLFATLASIRYLKAPTAFRRTISSRESWPAMMTRLRPFSRRSSLPLNSATTPIFATYPTHLKRRPKISRPQQTG